MEKECIKVIQEITGFEISKTQVMYTVSTKSIYLQVPCILKSELRFHHNTILQTLQNRLGKDGCPNIIF